jgi:hypothetical protein
MECANCIFSWYYFPSSHFGGWRWMWRQFHCQRLNIQHSSPLPSFQHFLFLIFSTLLLSFFFFICVQVSVFPFPSLFSTIFLLRFLHSFFFEHYNFEKTHDFLQQMKMTCDSYLVYFRPSTFCMFFFRLPIVL